MGRLKNAKAKVANARLAAREMNNSTPKSSSAVTVPAILAKTQELMAQMDFELARRFAHRILEMEADHVEARQILGIIEAEAGNIEQARMYFKSLIPPSANASTPPPYSAYLYLAQLTESDPREALAYYQSAVDLLLLLIKGKERIEDQPLPPASPEEDVESIMKRTVISALVAMVEIWMTSDLCFEEEAERTCDSLAMTAIEADPENVEALECLASVRMSQSKADEARQCVEKAWSVLKSLDADDPRTPPLSCRLSLTRRFLELSLYAEALILIQSILAADDEEIDAWYLQGWCFFLMAKQSKDQGTDIEGLSWNELAQDSRDCLEACQTFYVNNEHEDEALIQHVRELIGELEAGGIKPSAPEPEEDVAQGEDEEEWEDDDDDVEMG